MGHSALCLLKILYGNPRPGVADGYSLSRPHGDLLSRDFPAVRDGESADTVIIDGDVLGGNAVLLFRMVHVDMVNQLRHHALGNLGGVGVPPDRFKKRVNVHPLALALFQLQPQRLDPLGVLPLLLLVPLGHLRKPGVPDHGSGHGNLSGLAGTLSARGGPPAIGGWVHGVCGKADGAGRTPAEAAHGLLYRGEHRKNQLCTLHRYGVYRGKLHDRAGGYDELYLR